MLQLSQYQKKDGFNYLIALEIKMTQMELTTFNYMALRFTKAISSRAS